MSEYGLHPLIIEKIKKYNYYELFEIKNTSNKIENFLELFLDNCDSTNINLCNSNTFLLCNAFLFYQKKKVIDRCYLINLPRMDCDFIIAKDNNNYLFFNTWDLIAFYYGNDELEKFKKWLKYI